jgi:hypothetical protein
MRLKKRSLDCPDAKSVQTVSVNKSRGYRGYRHWPEWGEYHPDDAPIMSYVCQLEKMANRFHREADISLRSVNEVIGYHIQTLEISMGHVSDFIIDDQDWTVRFIVVSTKNWLPGQDVLVASLLVEKIRWVEKKVYVYLTKDELMNSPVFEPESFINQLPGGAAYDYHGRPNGI